ncbi:MAG: hypothetical protein WC569_03290 [Candidatus Omnitrophota bacterium]
MLLDIVILSLLILAALWTTMTRSLLRSAIGLASVSAALTIIMFRLRSPVAAVFELSVCSGFISVLFVTAISLTNPLTRSEIMERMKDRLNRFWYLPLIVAAAGLALSLMNVEIFLRLPPAEAERDVRNVLWNMRQLDLLGHIILLILGSFGVAVLFKKQRDK